MRSFAALVAVGCLMLLMLTTAAIHAQQRYAFVVGAEDYSPEFFSHLDYAEDDAVALSERLRTLGFHITRMTGDENNPDYKPTDPATIL
ncbi:MAG: hypothetical protein KDA47_23060, partial [Planctomycetales bacterium]|nr:hypothetical protein [Planctomycetales bacterium]